MLIRLAFAILLAFWGEASAINLHGGGPAAAPPPPLWADPVVNCTSGGGIECAPTAPQPSVAGDIIGVALKNTGSTQAGYVTLGHMFRDGDISAATLALRSPTATPFVARYIGGASGGTVVPMQIDALRTYADGSLEHGAVTFLAPSIAGGATQGVMLATGSAALPSAPASIATLASGSNGSGTYQASAVFTGATAQPCNAVSAGALACGLPSGTETATTALTACISGSYTTWLNGPLVHDYVCQETVFTSALKLQFDVRAYADHTTSTNIIFDNTWFTETGKFQQNYNVVLKNSAGSTAQTYSNVLHYPYAFWAYRIYDGNPPSLNVQFDVPYFQATRAWVPYDPSLGVATNAITTDYGNLNSTNTQPITGTALVYPYMPDTGGRPDIGPQTSWVARWMMTQDPEAYTVMVAEANAGTGIPWTFTDSTTGLLVNGDTYGGVTGPSGPSTFWLNNPTTCGGSSAAYICPGSDIGQGNSMTEANSSNGIGTIIGNVLTVTTLSTGSPVSLFNTGFYLTGVGVTGNPSILSQLTSVTTGTCSTSFALTGCGTYQLSSSSTNITSNEALVAQTVGSVTPNVAHIPDLNYVVYMVTADWYYLRAFESEADYTIAGTGTRYYKDTSNVVIMGAANQLQIRAVGWAWREMEEAAYLVPNSDPLYSYFAAQVPRAVTGILQQYVTDGIAAAWTQTYGFITNGSDQLPFTSAANYQAIPWQQGFSGIELSQTQGMGFGSTINTELSQFLAWSDNWMLGVESEGALGQSPFNGPMYTTIVTDGSANPLPTWAGWVAYNNANVISLFGGCWQSTTPTPPTEFTDCGLNAINAPEGGYPFIAASMDANLFTYEADPVALGAWAFNVSNVIAYSGYGTKASVTAIWQNYPNFSMVPKLPDGVWLGFSQFQWSGTNATLTGNGQDGALVCTGTASCTLDGSTETTDVMMSSTGTNVFNPHAGQSDYEYGCPLLAGQCTGSDTFNDAAGNTNYMQQGQSTTSTFKFVTAGDGQNIIGRWNPTSGMIEMEHNLNGNGITTSAGFVAACAVVGSDLVCNLGSGNNVTLKGVGSLSTSNVTIL